MSFPQDIMSFLRLSKSFPHDIMSFPRLIKSFPQDITVETELKVTQSALDVHMGCTPFVKD